ncbi:hypothetical protein ZEAMMB73_Zm00001d036176 [Zea mays]|uniref:Uncharacterized protein n=1 Tax=Zea mays TaxID=4577 RepID=A0A1D6LL44_MAIZE|nr:hypothetical protein ZEAMMB73_Zm00001d036176 [Zea mays]
MCFDSLEVNSARVDCLVRSSAPSSPCSRHQSRAVWFGPMATLVRTCSVSGAPSRPCIAASCSDRSCIRVQPLWRNWEIVRWKTFL